MLVLNKERKARQQRFEEQLREKRRQVAMQIPDSVGTRGLTQKSLQTGCMWHKSRSSKFTKIDANAAHAVRMAEADDDPTRGPRRTAKSLTVPRTGGGSADDVEAFAQACSQQSEEYARAMSLPIDIPAEVDQPTRPKKPSAPAPVPPTITD